MIPRLHRPPRAATGRAPAPSADRATGNGFAKISALFLAPVMALASCVYMPFERAGSSSVVRDETAFAYRDAAVRDVVGTVYKYRKSNLDGTQASDVWIRIAAPDRTESLKVYPGAERRGYVDLVVARYDPATLMASRLEGWFARPDGARALNAVCRIEDAVAFVEIGSSSYEFVLGRVPSFNYNFDWCDFAFAYRHLVDPDSAFTVGVIAPDSWMRFGPVGDATFIPVGREARGGTECRRYEVSGSAFERGGGGQAWFDAGNRALVEFAMASRNNPGFASFRLVLADTLVMDDDAWDRFVVEVAKSATGK